MTAARTLFLRSGYDGATMEEIAALAGLTKRTLYNNYGDKEALFLAIVTDAMDYVDVFVASLAPDFEKVRADTLAPALVDLALRLGAGVLRPEVIALRRLLVSEAQSFPDLAGHYFERAPLKVIKTLAAGFKQLARAGVLNVDHPQRAASQFAYLVVGEFLDRSVLVGRVPSSAEVRANAREAVETFLARYRA